MEESWVNNVIINFFSTRVDIFPKNSVYKEFQAADGSIQIDGQSSQSGINSVPKFGHIVYQDESGTIHQSDPMMLKIMPGILITRYISFHFINEMNFYTKILPTLSALDESFASLFPKYYHGEMIFQTGPDKSAIILEDLKPRGFQMAAKKSFLDLDHLKLMMRKLGQFHAFSYKAKNCIPELFYPLVDNILDTNICLNWEYRDRLEHFGQRGLKHLRGDDKYKRYLPKIEALLKKADTIFEKTLTGDQKNPISVVCHGDYLQSNVMFRYENKIPVDMVLIDMATCRYVSPVLDLSSVLYMNSDQKMRNDHWDTLFDEYYTALKTTFPKNQVPTKSEILYEFVDKSFYQFLIATYHLMVTIADDNNILCTMDLDPDVKIKFQESRFREIPDDVAIEWYSRLGGQLGTEALSDILGDMIDREFICK